MFVKIIYVLFTLLLMSAHTRIHNSCLDNRCVCKRNKRDKMSSGENVSISCRLKNFKAFPAKGLLRAAWEAETIDLGQNEITSLPADCLKDQTKLKTLILDNNHIEDVDGACFNVARTSALEVNVSPLQFIDLTSNHLHFVPSCFGQRDPTVSSLDNLTTLLLGNNLFGSTIDPKSFSGIKNLQHLNLTNNGISIIPDLFFKRLPFLETLDLTWNTLTTTSRMLFPQQVPLETIRFDHNLLGNIPANLPTALKELRLASNKIQNLTKEDAEELNHLSNLQILDLSKNDIEYLIFGSFSNLANLVYLDLSHNALRYLESNTFYGARGLKYVFLYNNALLTGIADFTFSTLPGLTHLFLQRCLLSSLLLEDPSKSKSLPLKYLWLFDNPMTCNCRMVPLVRYLKEGNVEVDSNFRNVIVDATNTRVQDAVKMQLGELKEAVTPSVCAGPLNRHHEVAGKPILTVPEWYMTCPDEPFNVIVSCFLGLATFTGIVPVVFVLVHVYLVFVRFAQKHFKRKDQETEE